MILLMDIAITIIGVYMVITAIRMLVTKEVSRLVLAEEEWKKCRDPKGFAAYFAPRMLVFSLVITAVGIVRILCDTIIRIGNWSMLVLGIFLVAFLLFVEQLRKAKEQFC